MNPDNFVREMGLKEVTLEHKTRVEVTKSIKKIYIKTGKDCVLLEERGS